MRTPGFKGRGLLVSVAAVLATQVASAADALQGVSPLAARHHCDECHAVNETRIGPPLLAVASRYAGERGAATERLARKIIVGGAGAWGDVPMVPNERLSLDDARAIVRSILTLAPAPKAP